VIQLLFKLARITSSRLIRATFPSH